MNDELGDVFKRWPFVYKMRKLYCLLYSSDCAWQAAMEHQPDSAHVTGPRLHCRLDELDGLLAALSCTVRTPLLTVFFILVLYTPVYSLLFLYCSEIQGPLNAQQHSPPRVGGGRCGAADRREALSS